MTPDFKSLLIIRSINVLYKFLDTLTCCKIEPISTVTKLDELY